LNNAIADSRSDGPGCRVADGRAHNMIRREYEAVLA
jgi:hypothetical protein